MSIRKIAEMTGLSTTTVSHAINGTRAVSKESKYLIDSAIKEIGYRPNAAARIMKTNRSNTIALIIPSADHNNSTNCFFFDVLNGAKEYLQTVDYDLLVSTYDEQENSLETISILKRQWIDGVLLVPNNYNTGSQSLEELIGVPVVLLDRRIQDSNLPMVYSDNAEVTMEAIRFLHTSGKKHIAYLGGMMNLTTSLDRYNGYCRALKELNLPYEQDLVYNQLRYEMEEGVRFSHQVLQHGADAIFASNSVLSMGVLQYLMGYERADEISVVGFDDYNWANLVRPPLTTIRQDPYRLGWLGAKMLLSVINNKQLSKREEVVKAELVRRQ